MDTITINSLREMFVFKLLVSQAKPTMTCDFFKLYEINRDKV